MMKHLSRHSVPFKRNSIQPTERQMHPMRYSLKSAKFFQFVFSLLTLKAPANPTIIIQYLTVTNCRPRSTVIPKSKSFLFGHFGFASPLRTDFHVQWGTFHIRKNLNITQNVQHGSTCQKRKEERKKNYRKEKRKKDEEISLVKSNVHTVSISQF